MFLIIGLGNPGLEYSKTRHNIGFIATDFISDRYNFLWSSKPKFYAEMAVGQFDNYQTILCKPNTYMNLSGNSVAAICAYYKIPLKNIIVFHDDIDLPVGNIKCKVGGSAGGHNGLKSINSHIGSDYYRIRIGVGRPENNKYDVSDYVLSKFLKSEEDLIYDSINAVIDKLPMLLSGDIDGFKKSL